MFLCVQLGVAIGNPRRTLVNPCSSDRHEALSRYGATRGFVYPQRLICGGFVRLSIYCLIAQLLLLAASLPDLLCFLKVGLICVHGLHNPGLTRLAVLLIHGRPRSMFSGSFADSPFLLVEALH